MNNNDYIDYGRVSRAQTYYSALGYLNIDAPWLVSTQAVLATLPTNSKIFQTHAGALVGSAEQSFIEMIHRGDLQPGRYQATAPCFRDEKEYNELTRPWFFKVELIWYMPEDTRLAYETVLNNALSCFFEISEVETFEAVQTAEGYDIFFNGIELGSYGVREMGKHTWVYGTGLAEPRFSIAMRRQHQIAAISMKSEEPPSTVAQPDISTFLDDQAPASVPQS